MRRFLPNSGNRDGRRRIGRLLGAAAMGVATWALVVEPRRTRIRRVDLSLEGWPAAHDGFRIVLLSDLHTGAPHVGEGRVTELVELANAEGADLVALLGDYVDPDVT